MHNERALHYVYIIHVYFQYNTTVLGDQLTDILELCGNMHYQVHGHVHVGHVHVKPAFEYLRTCTLPSASNGTQTQDTLHSRQSALPLSYQVKCVH